MALTRMNTNHYPWNHQSLSCLVYCTCHRQYSPVGHRNCEQVPRPTPIHYPTSTRTVNFVPFLAYTPTLNSKPKRH